MLNFSSMAYQLLQAHPLQHANTHVNWVHAHGYSACLSNNFSSADKPGYSWHSWCRCAILWSQFSRIFGTYFFNFFHFMSMLFLTGICFILLTCCQNLRLTFPPLQVSEFSPSTSTAMGLPREFHEQCRMLLEKDYVKVLPILLNSMIFFYLLTCGVSPDTMIFVHRILSSYCLPCSDIFLIVVLLPFES